MALDDEPRTWHASPSVLAVVVVACAVIVVFGVFLLIKGAEPTDRASGGVIVAVGVILGWRTGFHPFLRLNNQSVTIVNPVRTVVVPLASIVERATPGYNGITIRYAQGDETRRVTAWAIQKTNFSAMLRRKTRADRVAAAIDEAVTRAASPPTS